MSRDGNGNYTLPAGNPVISGEVIDTNWANPTLADIGNELTNSLSRSGKGGMLVPFRIADGSVASPSLGFTSEPSSGLFKSATNDLRMSVAGVGMMRWNASSVDVFDPTGGVWSPSATKAYVDAAVDAAVGALTPIIGSVLIRMDAISPAAIYAGTTWALVTGDASLSFGDGSAQTGVASGSNDVAVPLLRHSHANTVSDNISASQVAHSHYTGHTTNAGDNTTSPARGVSGGNIYFQYSASAQPAITVSGGVSISNANAGTSGASMNVKGAQIALNVWKRTA
jgi:hypothetical protein